MRCTRDVSITPELPEAFVSLEEVKAFLGVTGTDEDTYLTALAAVASQMIEGYCGNILAERTITETLELPETQGTLLLRHFPVSELTSVSIDGDAKPLADYRALKGNGMVRKTDRTEHESGEYVAVYVAGFAIADLPAPIKNAALEQIKALYQSKGRQAGVRSESVPDVATVEYADEAFPSMGVNGVSLPAVVASQLGPYVARFQF